MINGVDHVNIYTAKPAETRAFYEGVLGLVEGYRPQFGMPGLWLYSGPNPILHLVFVDIPRDPRGGIDHVSFAVKDFDATLARLDEAGIPYRAIDIPDGLGRQAFVKDPNGITIELTWRTAAAAQSSSSSTSAR